MPQVVSVRSEFISRYFIIQLCVRVALYVLFLCTEQLEPAVRAIPADQVWRHSYPLTESRMSSSALWTLIYTAPAATVAPWLAYSRDWPDVRRAALAASLGLLVNGLATNVLKCVVGRPRPDFLARCRGRRGGGCAGDARLVADGRRSFPSGHASFCSCLAAFAALYWTAKLRVLAGDGRPGSTAATAATPDHGPAWTCQALLAAVRRMTHVRVPLVVPPAATERRASAGTSRRRSVRRRRPTAAAARTTASTAGASSAVAEAMATPAIARMMAAPARVEPGETCATAGPVSSQTAAAASLAVEVARGALSPSADPPSSPTATALAASQTMAVQGASSEAMHPLSSPTTGGYLASLVVDAVRKTSCVATDLPSSSTTAASLVAPLTEAAGRASSEAADSLPLPTTAASLAGAVPGASSVALEPMVSTATAPPLTAPLRHVVPIASSAATQSVASPTATSPAAPLVGAASVVSSAVAALTVVAPLLAAALVAASRVWDHRHHWEDVAAGYVLGVLAALAGYRCYYPCP